MVNRTALFRTGCPFREEETESYAALSNKVDKGKKIVVKDGKVEVNGVRYHVEVTSFFLWQSLQRATR